jgi:hypothetical protein
MLTNTFRTTGSKSGPGRIATAITAALALTFTLAACGQSTEDTESSDQPVGVEGVEIVSASVFYYEPSESGVVGVPHDADIVFAFNGTIDGAVQMSQVDGTVFRVAIDFTVDSAVDADLGLSVTTPGGKNFTRQAPASFDAGQNNFVALINAGEQVGAGSYKVEWTFDGGLAFADSVEAEPQA